MSEKSWLEEKLEDPEFLAVYEGEQRVFILEQRIQEQADEIGRLTAELDEYENAKKFVLDPPHDEIHCGCVQLLNHELLKVRDAARGYIKAHKLMRVRFQDATDVQIYEEAEDMLTERIAALDKLATPTHEETADAD